MFQDKKILFLGGGLILAVAILLTVVLVSGRKPKATPGQTVLTIWTYENADKSLIEQASSLYQKKVNFKLNLVEKNLNADYLTDSLSEIAAGKGPDIWLIPNDWMPKYHDKLVALNQEKLADPKAKKSGLDVYKDTYLGFIVSDNLINNQIYGMPVSVNPLNLYLNSRKLDDFISEKQKGGYSAEISRLQNIVRSGPKNWDEFTELVRAYSVSSGNKIERSAIALGRSDNVSNSVDILTALMMQNGVKMTSDDFKSAQFHTAENLFGGNEYPGRSALEYYTSFADPESENYTWNKEIGDDSIRAFAEEKTAMLIGNSSVEADVKRISPSFSYQRFSLPQIKETKNPMNYVSYNTYTVTRASKNPDLAWDFVLFMSNKENSQFFLSQQKLVSPRIADITGYDQPDNIYYGLKSSQTWFKPDPDKADQIFKEMVQKVNDGGNAQTALEGAASQISSLLSLITLQ